jgi:hypothetical protein
VKYLLSLLFLISCGESTLKIEEPENPVLVDGDTYSYVIVRLEFIEEMRQLCEDSLLPNDYETEELYDQAVAQCTLDYLSILDIGAIEEFNEEVCNNPQTQDEISVCEAIN